jgi:hypothetical protein
LRGPEEGISLQRAAGSFVYVYVCYAFATLFTLTFWRCFVALVVVVVVGCSGVAAANDVCVLMSQKARLRRTVLRIATGVTQVECSYVGNRVKHGEGQLL